MLLFLLVVIILLLIKFKNKTPLPETPITGFVASTSNEVILYDNEYNESIKLTRGSKVYIYSDEINKEIDARDKNQPQYHKVNNDSEPGIHKPAGYHQRHLRKQPQIQIALYKLPR